MLYYITHLRNPFDKVTDGIATLAVGTWVFPSWHDQLEVISREATNLLPIAGCTWLIVQTLAKSVDKYREWRGGRPPSDD